LRSVVSSSFLFGLGETSLVRFSESPRHLLFFNKAVSEGQGKDRRAFFPPPEEAPPLRETHLPLLSPPFVLNLYLLPLHWVGKVPLRPIPLSLL